MMYLSALTLLENWLIAIEEFLQMDNIYNEMKPLQVNPLKMAVDLYNLWSH